MSEYTRFFLSVNDIKRYIISEKGLRKDNPFIDDFIQKYLRENIKYFNGVHKVIYKSDSEEDSNIVAMITSLNTMTMIVQSMVNMFFSDWICQYDLYTAIARKCESRIYYHDFINVLDKSIIFKDYGFWVEHYSENSMTMERYIPINMVSRFIEQEYGDKIIKSHTKIPKEIDLISAETLTRKLNIGYNGVVNLLRNIYESPIDGHMVVYKNEKPFLIGKYLDYISGMYGIQKRYSIAENMDIIDNKNCKVSAPIISVHCAGIVDASMIDDKLKSFIPQEEVANPEVYKDEVVKNIFATFMLRHQDLENERNSQYPDSARIERIKKIIYDLVDLMKTQSEYFKKYLNIDITYLVEQYKNGKILSVKELTDLFAPKSKFKSNISHIR